MASKVDIDATIKKHLKIDPHFYDSPEPVGQWESEGGTVAPEPPSPDLDIVSGLSAKERREWQERIDALDHSVAYWRRRAKEDNPFSPNLPDHLQTWPSAYSPSGYGYPDLGSTRIGGRAPTIPLVRK